MRDLAVSMVLAIGLGVLATGCSCGDGEGTSCTSSSECRAGACVDGRCVRSDAAVPTDDGSLPPDAVVIDGGPRCEPACGAGEACVESACVADCRLPLAGACAGGLVCSEESGRCVMPGEECTPAGDFVPCGTAEFPPTCGPGAECAGSACVAAAGCTGVACDVAGVCRGIGCAGAGSGSITAITLDPIADAPRAAVAAIPVHGTVEGTGLCGLTVTIELRIETAVYVSAYNDATLWEVDLTTGARTAWATGISGVNGLATDPTGALYVLQDCTVGRVSGAAGARTFVPIATLATSGCSRLAVGPDGALYVSSTLEAWRVDAFTGAAASYGSIPTGIAAWGSTFLTGLGFLDDGSLIVGEHWRALRRIPPGGGASEAWADAPALALTSSDNPWNEGMAIDRDGLMHVGVFPSNATAGFVYRVEADRTTTVVADLASIRAEIPATNHTGIHGVAFGLDGSMYFTNQNTSGSTFEPFGQLIVRRPTGAMTLLASGFNFDWPRGYDGDVVVGTRSVATVTVPVRTDGTYDATLDAPDVDGAFEVRVSATDPATGRVLSDRDAARTLP